MKLMGQSINVFYLYCLLLNICIKKETIITLFHMFSYKTAFFTHNFFGII